MRLQNTLMGAMGMSFPLPLYDSHYPVGVMCPVVAGFECINCSIKHSLNPFGRTSKDLIHFNVLKLAVGWALRRDISVTSKSPHTNSVFID
jgi:hypothetical protein